jgi:hypothetical protein
MRLLRLIVNWSIILTWPVWSVPFKVLQLLVYATRLSIDKNEWNTSDQTSGKVWIWE